MSTATFNSVALGDGVTTVPTSGISRGVIEDEVSGVDGVTIRNRGGGRQIIEIECYEYNADLATRETYIQTLWASCGNAAATLAVTNSWGANKSWTSCLLIDIQPTVEIGTFLQFKIQFLRSPA